MHKFVIIQEGGISDGLMFEGDSVAKVLGFSSFDVATADLVMFGWHVEIPAVKTMESPGATFVGFLWTWISQPMGARDILL